MMVGFDVVGLSLAEEKKKKSAHTIDEYQTIYHQKLVPTSFIQCTMRWLILLSSFTSRGIVKMQGHLP
ncbi:MAG: hypothetical protein ACM3X1_09495 [Ignavibacteriales bacterium]